MSEVGERPVDRAKSPGHEGVGENVREAFDARVALCKDDLLEDEVEIETGELGHDNLPRFETPAARNDFRALWSGHDN